MTQIRKGQEFIQGELATLDEGYRTECVVEVVGQSKGNRLFTSVKTPNMIDSPIWDVMTRRLKKMMPIDLDPEFK